MGETSWATAGAIGCVQGLGTLPVDSADGDTVQGWQSLLLLWGVGGAVSRNLQFLHSDLPPN